MAISYLGAVAGQAINGSNVVLDYSGLNLVTGDLIVVFGGIPQTGSSPGPTSGYTLIRSTSVPFGVVTSHYKFLAGADAGSVTCAGGGNANSGVAYVLMAFRGVDPNGTIVDNGETGITQPDPPAVTPATAGSVICVFGAILGSSVSDTSVTAPTNYTLGGNASGNDNQDTTVAGAYRLNRPASSENPGAFSGFTTNPASALSAAHSIAFSPLMPSVVANPGSYTHTGTAAFFDIDRTVVAASSSYQHTGTAATPKFTARVVVADAGSYTHTGVDANLTRSRLLAADAGSYGLAGSTAGFLWTHLMAGEAGLYALVGSAATLLHGGRFLAAGAGSYGLSGTAAALLVDRIIGAGGGVYSLTGADATMGILSDRVLGAGGGVYELTGLEASLGLEGALAAQPGVYAITGAPADAMLDRLLASGNTTYELVGDDADQVLDRLVAASAGSYLLSGADVGLSRVGVRTLEAQPGLYVLTGAAAGLSLAFNGIRAESGGYLIDGQPVSLFFVEKPDPVRRVLHVTRASRTAHVSRNNRTLFVPRRSN